jgi:hypothetical protein
MVCSRVKFTFYLTLGGVILAGKNGSSRRENCPSASLSTMKPRSAGPGQNVVLSGKRPSVNLLRVRAVRKRKAWRGKRK